MHGQPDVVRLAEAGQPLRQPQPAPVVVVGQHDAHRPLFERGWDVGEGHHAHVGGQRHGRLARHRRHAGDGRGRVLQVLQQPVGLGGHLDGRLRRPGGVRVEPQRVPGKRLPQRPDRRDLLLRREHAALELDGPEPVPVDHPLGLRHDAGRVEGLGPLVGFRTGVVRPLVEQVRRERHRVAGLAAEQRPHRAPGQVPL